MASALLVIACFAAILFAVSALYVRRRRKQRRFTEIEEKPQNRFKVVLADNSYTPFEHLKRRPVENVSLKMHPYEEEISMLLDNPIIMDFLTSHEQLGMSGSYFWIETESQLHFLSEILRDERVFAVDTEQHSVRSFLGFTALMQISTQKADFLLDTIALHDAMTILQPVFADPSICKVFHGAENDILWLQRDFHIYVVNMFDTAKACTVLSKPHKSLAYLLGTYCGVSTNKILQRGDWRLRPLSKEMIHYARADAHYLLYIANVLASELKCATASSDDKFNFLFEASRRSNIICMQLYVKEIETPPGVSAATSIFSRNCSFQGEEFSRNYEMKGRLWKLSAWRDLMARIHDENLRYVLSDQALVALATKVPEHPTEVHKVISEADIKNGSLNAFCYFPSPSPIVVNHVQELLYLLEDMNVNIYESFLCYFGKKLIAHRCCSSSIHNHALQVQLSSIQAIKLFSEQNAGKVVEKVGKKASREHFIQKFSCKSQVYHNCKIYANDGRLLCYCNHQKLEWYLCRDLAKLVEENPPAIMLLFEPKGRPEDEDNVFYIQSKKNICVGCGEKNHYLRYRIIPSCYRMHFPEHLKSHRSHDIVLLCVDCHEIAHPAAERYKKKIASEFGIPLFAKKIVEFDESRVTSLTSVHEDREAGVTPWQLRAAAKALLCHGSRMPFERHEELAQVVKTYFGGREIGREDLEMALLVNLSPHKRQRFEKRKGLSSRHLAENLDESKTVGVDNLNCDIVIKENMHCSEDLLKVDDAKRKTIKERMTAISDSGFSVTCNNEISFDCGNNNCFSGSPPRQNVDKTSINSTNGGLCDGNDQFFCPSTSHPVFFSRETKKLSLLGHGTHGRKVVEHLLDKYGEDGISIFCQRWRQVFVEAVNPRFLPTGWDITHSGRRDFGDYSVYNPAKKQHI